jgi:hypothetical protein
LLKSACRRHASRLPPAGYLACCQTLESSGFSAFYLKKIGKRGAVNRKRCTCLKKGRKPHVSLMGMLQACASANLEAREYAISIFSFSTSVWRYLLNKCARNIKS